MNPSKAQAIIVAGGIGKRFASPIPKPLCPLTGKPIFLHSVLLFKQIECIESVILVANQQYASHYEKVIEENNLQKFVGIVSGGPTRCDSVYNGIQCVEDTTEIILIHDSVRPLITPKIVTKAISQCQEKGAVVIGVPAKSTIKRVDPARGTVSETLERNTLWEIQTPQVFKSEIIKRAYQSGDFSGATDDASLVERLGIDVYVEMGTYQNIKITTPDDIAVAQAFLDQKE